MNVEEYEAYSVRTDIPGCRSRATDAWIHNDAWILGYHPTRKPWWALGGRAKKKDAKKKDAKKKDAKKKDAKKKDAN